MSPKIHSLGLRLDFAKKQINVELLNFENLTTLNFDIFEDKVDLFNHGKTTSCFSEKFKDIMLNFVWKGRFTACLATRRH